MSGSGGTTIVTQTTPLPDRMVEFAEWQRRTNEAIADVPGFLRQAVIPPHPPTQVDWVILQHFADRDTAVAWLHSPLRAERLAEAQPLILGRDDVHLVAGEAVEAPPAPVSLVISTRVKPGQEAAFRIWERRMTAAQARAPRAAVRAGRSASRTRAGATAAPARRRRADGAGGEPGR